MIFLLAHEGEGSVTGTPTNAVPIGIVHNEHGVIASPNREKQFCSNNQALKVDKGLVAKVAKHKIGVNTAANAGTIDN